jgi:hypothetical protein
MLLIAGVKTGNNSPAPSPPNNHQPFAHRVLLTKKLSSLYLPDASGPSAD